MKKNLILILLLIALIIAVWFISGYFIYTHFDQEKGTIGDLFSPINALFAGFAFCGIIMTIYLQQKELSLQRQELVNTREIFQRQKFENTFFQLTNIQQTITAALHHEYTLVTQTNGETTKRDEVKLNGRRLFWAILDDFREMHEHILGLSKPRASRNDESLDRQMSRRFHEYKINPEFSYDVAGVYKNINLKDDAAVTRFLFDKINTFYMDDLSHYFKHLYKILEYINEAEADELSLVNGDKEENELKERYYRYADFLQAQLSVPEMVIIYYHSLLYPKTKQLMEKYHFFNSLASTLLISLQHANWHTNSTKA
jgi:hypothetical protein